MLYNVLAILFCIIVPIIIIKEPLRKIIKKENIKDIVKKYKYEMIAYLLIVLGCIIRSVGINLYPIGLNVDEASSTYDAFSILNYGIDRNGNSFPVFLEAWGSGQNALYTYIMIPFIKILGLNIISTRLPMVIISCVSLFIWYNLLCKMNNKKFAIIGLAFFVICPWHIMKSRWGLESNIFPDLVLWAVYFIITYLEQQKSIYFYIASIILGLTVYAYGTAYFFLPLFWIPLLIYLRVKKKITTIKMLSGLAIVGIISLPIILYVLINTFHLSEFQIGPFTVPKLPVNRYEEQTNLFSGNLIVNLFHNFSNSIQLLITQNDGLQWNSLPYFGMYYIISLPFTIVGFIIHYRKKNQDKMIWNIWFGAAFLLLFFFTDVNINRINILILPLLYYTVEGIYFWVIHNKVIQFILITIYFILFTWFMTSYIHLEHNGYTFVENIDEVINFVSELNVDEIYIDYTFKEPYIYVLYYTQTNPKELMDTIEYFDKTQLGRFDNVKSFGKYHFYMPSHIETTKKVAYITDINHSIEITQYENFKNKKIENFIINYNE